MSQQKNLLSMTLDKKWQQLTPQQQRELLKKIKADAAVKLIQANQYIETNNLYKAKQLLINIGDSCSLINEEDQQIAKWYQFSCNYLAIIHKKILEKQNKKMMGELQKEQGKQDILIVRYNKFTGEFEFQKGIKQDSWTREAMIHVTKLNSILFGFNNSQSSHSLLVILKTYWLPFLIILLISIMMVVYLSTYRILIEKIQYGEQWAIYPLIVLGLGLVGPISMVFVKEPNYHNDRFFQKKLGQEIKKINEDLKKRQINLNFEMPYGSEINIKILN